MSPPPGCHGPILGLSLLSLAKLVRCQAQGCPTASPLLQKGGWDHAKSTLSPSVCAFQGDSSVPTTPLLLASPTHNMMSDAHVCHPQQPFATGWLIGIGVHGMPADMMHPRSTHGPVWAASLSTANLLHPPVTISLCLGVCGCLELRLEVICLSPAVGSPLASANQFYLHCH